MRVLLSVADVTDARAAEKLKDDLLREKAILLQELQHRVANSLQIIASILLQSARSVDSVETRGHLQDAHKRVMSVAAVQKQLTESTLEDVNIPQYFTDLYRSIAASMIHDHSQLSLEVSADEASTPPEISVSLGLIVTELVINALKHAFPDRRAGKISVGYRTKGLDWRLSVGDDGIGMTKTASKSGLGTTIVEALAKQLDAKVDVHAAGRRRRSDVDAHGLKREQSGSLGHVYLTQSGSTIGQIALKTQSHLRQQVERLGHSLIRLSGGGCDLEFHLCGDLQNFDRLDVG